MTNIMNYTASPRSQSEIQISRFADELAALKNKVDILDEGGRVNGLGNSSVEDGWISFYDEHGIERARVGKQEDGTYSGGRTVNNDTPPLIPAPPTVEPVINGLRVRSNGPTSGQWAADFLHLNVYVENSETNLTVFAGTITGDPGIMVVAPLERIPYRVWLTSVNESGAESSASEARIATPKGVEGLDILEDAIGELQLADDAVTQAKIAVGAVGTAEIAGQAVDLSKLADGSVSAAQLLDGSVETEKIASEAVVAELIAANAITTGKIAAFAITSAQLAANSVLAEKIAAEAISAEKIAANAITADKLVALSVTADKIAANAVSAASIQAGAITASKLEADMVLTSRVIAGEANGKRVELSPAGLYAYTSALTRTLEFDNATGALQVTGTLTTKNGTASMSLNPGNTAHQLQVPGLYLNAVNSTYPALIWSTPKGTSSTENPSSINMMSSLDDNTAGAHILMWDQGVQLGYDKLYSSGDVPNPEIRPVGGSAQFSKIDWDLRMCRQDATAGTEGGFVRGDRESASLGFLFSSTNYSYIGMESQYGTTALYGKWLQNHLHPDAGMLFQRFAVNASVGGANISYGVTMRGVAAGFPRLILTQAETATSGGARTWTESQSATGALVRWDALINGYMHFASIALG